MSTTLVANDGIKTDTNIVKSNPFAKSKNASLLNLKEPSRKTHYLNNAAVTPLTNQFAFKTTQTDRFGNNIGSDYRHAQNAANIQGKNTSYSVEYTFKKRNK
jgi:hypothetical protein